MQGRAFIFFERNTPVSHYEIPTLVKSGQSFQDIQARLITEAEKTIEKYGLARDKNGRPNTKMAMSLVHAVASAVEMSYGQQTREYVATRLNEQIERYITLGFHDVAGYSEHLFHAALEPLIAKTLDFFSPPSERPIRDGEFTVLLVLPKDWVPSRRLLIAFLGESLSRDVDQLHTEKRGHGGVSPQDPYVLVGINGGRGLKDCSIEKADMWVEQNARTYLSLHEWIQLYLIRPNFLSAENDLAQSEVLVLGEKWKSQLISFATTGHRIQVVLTDEKNVQGGVGVGKPHYAKIITV